MSLEQWLPFAVASAVLVVIPGPTVMLVVAYALSQGRRAALATVAGVALGDLTAMTTSLAGLGVLLATSAALFTVVKWIGAGYLMWLGYRLWRAPVADTAGLVAAMQEEGARAKRRRMLGHAFVVTALNPKGIVFFVAFVPQFVRTDAPVTPQLVILVATFVGIATTSATSYALLAAGARRTIRKPSVQRLVNRIGGTALIAAGVLTVAWRRTA
jgi:threonine/homoserine/homoserine lactone efflux protein